MRCGAFATYLAETPVDRLILFNAGIMEYGAAFHAARQAGVTVVEWEQSPHAVDQYLLSINRKHGALDMRPLLGSDDAATSWRSAAQAGRRVVRQAGARGDWRKARPRGRHVPDVSGRALLAQLGLDPDKPIAALFPNVTWDTATLDREVAFASVADWALQTMEFFADHPEWQLVVRTHPVEDRDVRGIRRRDPAPPLAGLPPNVRIVEVEEPLFSYRLLEAAQIGLYYTGTLGLEMTMLGILRLTGCAAADRRLRLQPRGADGGGLFRDDRARLRRSRRQRGHSEEMARRLALRRSLPDPGPEGLALAYQRFWPSILETWPMDARAWARTARCSTTSSPSSRARSICPTAWSVRLRRMIAAPEARYGAAAIR